MFNYNTCIKCYIIDKYYYTKDGEFMYKRNANGWLKHWDFILLDLIVIQIAYVLSIILAGYGIKLYQTILYRNMSIIIEIIDLVIILLFSTFRDVLKKGHYKTFVASLYQGILVSLVSILYLFLIQEGQNFSRLTIIYTGILYVLLTFIMREVWKNHLLKGINAKGIKNKQSLLLVTGESNASDIVKKIQFNPLFSYEIIGLVIIDKDMTGEVVDSVPVVARIDNAAEYVCKEWVDEALVILPSEVPYPKELIDELEETGIAVHVNIPYISTEEGKKQFVEDVGGFTVLTTSPNYATPKQLLLKRIMDIFAGIIGCIFTCIIFIFVAPFIYSASPGPIIYSQERIGKNGKPFKIYKFRSMYLDADERKAELMKQNKINDARMFKMDFDPRIIGNKILPDGTHKTGVGEFIRKTSLDEFPQFFNVLKGDMSLVGTRPPLKEEVNLYELHHHARLATKPGITGLWQVSGRSNITDFEEVVKLDREYINTWSIGLDIKIIFKTILVVFKREGSM